MTKSEEFFYPTMIVALVGIFATIACLMVSFAMIIAAENDSQSIVGGFGVLASIVIFITTIYAINNITKEETKKQ